MARRLPEDGDWEMVTAGYAAPSHTGVTWNNKLRFWVNNEEVVIQDPSPSLTLLDWLRDVKRLTGTHVGCGEGGCGICTVALARLDPESAKVKLVPINSCLRRLCALDGCHVITTEGIGCKKTGFHAIQTAIAEGNGSQCGFCTPGWVMNMYSLLSQNDKPSAEVVERNFDGNLCRCTGYRPILTAFGKFAQGGDHCGQHRSISHPAAMLSYAAEDLHFEDAKTHESWYRPTTMQGLAEITSHASESIRYICASTADGVAKYYQDSATGQGGTTYVDISLLPELQGVHLDDTGLHCGATVSIEALIGHLESPEASKLTSSFEVLADHMKRIASVQIRSVGSWAGNLMLTREHPAFASDMATILSAAGAIVHVQQGAKTVDLTVPELLTLENKQVLVISVTIPKGSRNSLLRTFKASQRHVFAHAVVNLGAYIDFADSSGTVNQARIMVGGACKRLLNASKTADALRGRKLDDETLKLATAALKSEIQENASDDLRNSSEYREQLAVGFLYKTFLCARKDLPEQLKSAVESFIPADARPISTGTESWGENHKESPVSEYVPKRSAFIQASGEAQYPSDYGGRDALFGQVVFSTSANAKLVALDASQALEMPGVHSFIVASAIPGVNVVNAPLGGDNLKEKIFFEVGDVIPCVGSQLGLIVADTWKQARSAAKCVKQKYAQAECVVASVEDALRLRRIEPGDCGGGGVGSSRRQGTRPQLPSKIDCDGVMPEGSADLLSKKGSFKSGGQSHFYMETQSVCVTPHDGNQWEVVCSDQDANFTQQCLSSALGVPMHNINVKVPRAGGAFGGKLMRQCLNACAAAVAANSLRCPVRIQNERSDDMQIVCGREPIQFDYEVTFDASGRVASLNLDMTISPGWFYGDVAGDANMAVTWSDNCYHYSKFKVTPHAALTNTPHTTPMRAPGCMQSVLAAEVIMEHVAKTVGKSTEEVQALNFYQESQTTPFGDHIGEHGYNWTIPVLWSQIQKDASLSDRQAKVKEYNSKNRWTKRGIAISPAKYIMNITTDSYSSGALVSIYGDGSVLVSSGGSEVGQGLNTKIALCTASTLGAPLDKVSVGPRETSKIPDNTGTGGSGTSECSSEAAIMACQELNKLLQPYRDAKKSWEDVVKAACADKVGLNASAWYANKDKANANNYATYGTGIAEVQIDVLTGEVCVERVDLLMDLGVQLDAAVDLGQIQGGFVMALGYLLTEELKVDKSGTQLNLGTWHYKPPSAYDIPLEFNVSLLKDSPNPVGILGSKASAEPAMCVVPCVYLAVKNAIYAARAETGVSDWFMLDTPLTPETIRAAVGQGTDVEGAFTLG
eukprot:TRINITY_DN28156_c0_g3_i1.p1 TRINITY_DN28156_c0_g3~~TRINITY_DN28156_c0_g3_i1.p1  ORF type:complete len:1336 (-),score=211.24 TRINITY_DN28156_c0_g3_i1:97-4053(-)